MNTNLKHALPFIVATIMAVAAVAIYVRTGQGSRESGLDQLKNTENIDQITQTGSQSLTIKCKDGTSYKISFKPGQSNYEDLVYNKCGAVGAESQ